VVCDFNFIVNGKGLLKITASHLHWKSGYISETVIDRDIVTTGHLQEVRGLLVYSLSNSSNYNDLLFP